MTSVFDKYYRRIIQNIDNVTMKFDISALLVKSKEHDSKIDTNKNNIAENLTLINSKSDIIEANKNNIAENLTLINSKFEANKNNIAENLTLINSKSDIIEANKNNISENLTLINSKSDIIEANRNNIAENLTLINSKFEANKNNIAENLTLINSKSDIIETNRNNITNNYNITQINKKKSEFNTTLIDNNKNNITDNYNITQINKKKSEFNTTLIDNNINNMNSIKNDTENYYKLKDIITFDVEKTNVSEEIHINLPKFVIIQSSLNNNFKKDSYLEFDSSILIFFNKNYINIGFFHILLENFNSENELLKEMKLPLASGAISKFSNITNSCIIKLPDNFNKIFFKLSIKLNDQQNRNDSILILDFDNKIYFKYFEK